MSWKKLDAFLIGKVIHPFKKPVKCGLLLNLGDTVIIKSQNMEWYYGYSLMEYTSESSLGIFPSNHVIIIGKDESILQNDHKENNDLLEAFSKRMLTTIIVHTSLWISEIRTFEKEEELKDASDLINQIINLFLEIRNVFNCKEKLMKFYHSLWILINKVNGLFNLDLTIQRNILSTLTVTDLPVIHMEKLYMETSSEHRELSMDIDDAYHSDASMSQLDSIYSNDMVISVDKFEFFGCSDELILQWMIVDIYQDCQFEHFWQPIQEVRKGKPKWKDEMFIFKSIPFEIKKEGFYLAAYVYRIGQLVIDASKQGIEKFRRPVAFGSYNLKELQSNCENITINFFNLNETDFLKSTMEILRMKLPSQLTSRFVQVTINIDNNSISSSRGLDENHILESVSLLNNISNECDRHCLYIRLRGAEFDRANKKSAKNVEAQLSIKDSNGEKQTCIVSNSKANNKVEYISAVTYHSNSPKWNDLIKIDLHAITLEECYIYIEFYHCTTKGKRGEERKYFSCCFLQLNMFLDCGNNEETYTIKTKKNFSIPKKLPRSSSISSTENERSISKEICNLTLILCSTHLSNKKEINEFLLNEKEENFQISNLLHYLKEIQTMTNEDFLKPKLRKSVTVMTKGYFLSSYACHNETIEIELFITCQILFDKYIKLGLKEELFSYLRNEFQFIEALLNGIKNVFQNILDLNISFEILAMVMNSMEPVFMILSNYSELEHYYQISERIKEILKWNISLFEGNYKSESSNDIRKLILESTNSNLKHIRNLISIDVLIEYFDSLFKSQDFRNEQILPKEKLDFIDQLLQSGIHQDCIDILLILFHPTIKICSKLIDISGLYILQAIDVILHLMTEARQLLQEERVFLFSDKIMQKLFTQTFVLFTSKQCKDLQKNLLTYRRESEDPLANGSSLTSKTIECSPESEKMFTLLFAYLEEWCEISNSDITVTDMYVILFDMKQLLESEIYPKHWLSIYLKISNVCVRILNKVAEYIEDLTNEIHVQLIRIFFEACFTFIMQNCLKLETFSFPKCKKIMEKYGDMRITVMDCFLHVCAIKSTILSTFEKTFILQMINKIFHISLLAVVIIRRKIIPFFSHMIARLLDKYDDRNEILQEFIPKTEMILREGYGDEAYYKLLCDLIQQNQIHEDVSEVVKVLAKLMDLHLENRKLSKQASKVLQNQFLLFAFMKFYKEDVDASIIFSYYSNKFSLLLETEGHMLEAALVLKMQFESMPWNEETIPCDTIFFENFKGMNSENEKVNLGKKIMKLLIETKEYEEAALICDNFCKHYLSTFNYKELSPVLKQMSELYELITNESRLKMSYYRITFVGGALPSFMKHCRDYIFKCSMWFKVNNIKEMLHNDFPDSEVQFYQSTPPIESPYEHKMIIYLAKMDPIPFDTDLNRNRKILVKIRDFYKDHNICSFSSDHPFHKGQVDKDNEIKTLNISRYTVMTELMPNVFMWNPIINETRQTLSPIEVATDTILKKNQTFKDTIDEYTDNPHKDLRPFSMLLTGTLDAGVNGGMAKYIKAFFDESNAEQYDIFKIKEFKEALIEQKNVLNEALVIHKKLITPQVLQLHERCEQCFRILSETVGDLNVFKNRSFSAMPTFDAVYARLESINVKTTHNSVFDSQFSEKSISFFQEDIRTSENLSLQFCEGTNRSSDDYRSSNSTINIPKSYSGSEKSLLCDVLDQRPRKISSADEEKLTKLAEEQISKNQIYRQFSTNPSNSTPEIYVKSNHYSDDDVKISPLKSPPLPPENELPLSTSNKAKKSRGFWKNFTAKRTKEVNVLQSLQSNNSKLSVETKRRANIMDLDKFKTVDTD